MAAEAADPAIVAAAVAEDRRGTAPPKRGTAMVPRAPCCPAIFETVQALFSHCLTRLHYCLALFERRSRVVVTQNRHMNSTEQCTNSD